MRPQSNLARGIESVTVALVCLLASFLFMSVTYWAAPMALIAWFFAITASRSLRRPDAAIRRGARIRIGNGFQSAEFVVVDVHDSATVTLRGPVPTIPAGASARVLSSTIIPSGIVLAFFAALPFFLLITSWFITEARFKSLESLSPSPVAEEKAKGGSTPHRLPRSREKGARFDSADEFSGETKGTAGPAATAERNLGAGHIYVANKESN